MGGVRFKFTRRDFIRFLLAAGVAGVAGSYVVPTTTYLSPRVTQAEEYPRSLLVKSNGEPLKASELQVNKLYLFPYPLKDTMNFLINLGDENDNPVEIPELELPLVMEPIVDISYIMGGSKEIEIPENVQTYKFPGGVGPNKSIVAFNGICQHLGCIYPQLQYTRPGEKTSLPTNPPEIGENGGVIFCRCHGSAYDPYRGAAVLLEPVLKPLPAIVLEWDQETDQLYAVGVVGPVIFGKQCNLCGELVGDKVTVLSEDEYKQQGGAI